MKRHRLRVGCDIVDIRRFRKILSRTPGVRRRIFLPEELADTNTARLAGIFAAKEAVMKALNLAAGRWRDIAVLYAENGKPRLNLRTDFSKKMRTHDISIAHDGNYVMAFACFIEDD